ERARRVALDQLRAQEGDLGQAAFRAFAGALWRTHPYRPDPLGSADTLASLGRRQLLDHQRRHLGLAGPTIAAVGDRAPERAAGGLRGLRAAAPGGGAAPAPPAEPPRAEPDDVFCFVAGDQAHAVIGYPGVTLRDPDRFALAVLAQILGGEGGRLPLELTGG